MAGAPFTLFRVTYGSFRELREDMQQMTHGGLLVKVNDASGLELDTPVALELVLPDDTVVAASARVLQVLAGHGVAVAFGPDLLAELGPHANGTDAPGAAATRHERLAPGAPRSARATTSPPQKSEPSTAEKIQIALHGNRDQRNAILRDPNRMLHPYVLRNPQISVDDVLAMAKNAQLSPELLKQIGERQDWLQRPQIAVALARNPKTPANIAIQALAYVPNDTLRQLAKGTGAPPHVVQAARKKVLR